MRLINDSPFEENYEVTEQLGSGQFAIVKRVLHRTSGRQFAAKFIKKRHYPNSRRGILKSHILREIEILQLLKGHHSIVELIEVFETATEVVLILEFVFGGELFDYVDQKDFLEESEAAIFVFQILKALQHCHRKNVAHLDIKPENIMLKSKEDKLIKLIDFGLSRQINPGQIIREMIGTPEFVAPEIINYEPLTIASDCWALGVVTYILLSGTSPFLGHKGQDQTFFNISNVIYSFGASVFDHVSNEAKDFISTLLVRDVMKRATVEDSLRHPWIRRFNAVREIPPSPNLALRYNLQKMMVPRLRWKRAIKAALASVNFLRLQQNGEHWISKDDAIVTSAFLCCENGDAKMLSELLSVHKVSPNLSNQIGETLLCVASGSGLDELVVMLLKHGADPNDVDFQGETPLFWAARNGHAHVANQLLKSPKLKLSNEYDPSMALDAYVNRKNGHEETALEVATKYGQIPTVLFLLEHGADISAQDEDCKGSETCLHRAACDGNSTLLGILCRFASNLDMFNQVAASRGHLECVETLIDCGALIDEQDHNGQTALHLALRRHHREVGLYLINKGCGLNIFDNNGEAALHVAAESDLPVQTLCQMGADPNIQNLRGFTPLHIAARKGHVEIARQLCLHGANINLMTNDGLTAEFMAMSQENSQVAVLLSKIKSDKVRKSYAEQLESLNKPLCRIKLKVFGHPTSRKNELLHMLQQTSSEGLSSAGTMSNRLKRFSDDLFNYVTSSGGGGVTNGGQMSPADSGVSVGGSEKLKENAEVLPSDSSPRRTWPTTNGHTEFVNDGGVKEDIRGIEIHNALFPKCGEFSIWDFSGQEQFHAIYDHFVGNTDCIHIVCIQCTSDPGRLTPSEPLGHCGIVARRSVVAVVGTYTGGECPTTKTEAEAMLRTLKLRFESYFEISDQLYIVDLKDSACNNLRLLKEFLGQSREEIVSRLQRPLDLVNPTITYLKKLREELESFPCITWPLFTDLIRRDVNPLTTDSHCRQLIQQLQLIGEVVYLRDEFSEIDYIILIPDWLGTHIIGTLFSEQFSPRPEGVLSTDDFAATFPEVKEPLNVLHLLKMLQICSPVDDGLEFEFPQFIQVDAPKNAWTKNKMLYTYGGMRIKPVHGMASSLQSIFPRIQVALRRSMLDFKDPLDAMLNQWKNCSIMNSTNMEAYLRLIGDAIEIQVRGPAERAASCFYFLEDLANLVEQTSMEVAPGISLERHFLSPRDLREHRSAPSVYTPEQIMEMQQKGEIMLINENGEEERFMDVTCFGSKEICGLLILGVDIPVTSMSFVARSELASLLDTPDSLGRDWSILAVKLGLMEQLPEVDYSGVSLSRTDQLLAEWSIRAPEYSTTGRLCSVLKEMGRDDAVSLLYRRTPLYQFLPLHEQQTHQILMNHDQK